MAEQESEEKEATVAPPPAVDDDPGDEEADPDAGDEESRTISAASGSAEAGHAGEPTEPGEQGEATAATSDDKGVPHEAEDKPLLVRGNPLRGVRGGITMGVGLVLALFVMAKNSQWRFGVPIGFVFIAVAALGVLDFVGSFDDKDEPAGTTTIDKLFVPLGGALGAGLIFLVLTGMAGAGMKPQWLCGLGIAGAFIGLAVALFQIAVVLGPMATDDAGLVRPLLRRHGFWLLVLGSMLYFPTLGMFALWDPWETHYGEVAREILARDDWISLWWAQDGWFWSKPILNFWIQSLSMASLGTHFQPDAMMNGALGPGTAHPEWVVRMPVVVMTLVAMYVLYKGAAKVFGRRAGFLGAAVLATMPDWFFLAHQTMTDMPFVAAMTAAMGLMLLGLNTDEDQRAKVYELRLGGIELRFSGFHLVFGAILLVALPQVLYLLSRNVEFIVSGSGPKGIHWHWDEFRSGSAGNCGIPGNEACTLTHPAMVPKALGANPDGFGRGITRTFLAVEPGVQAVVWTAVLSGLLYLNWGERRVRRLFYLAAWFFAAIATMAKGPAGFALPIICALAYIATKKRWAEIGRLEPISGILIILGVALPWFAAMYVRHGSPFTDRLIFHDMVNRAFGHVHDTNEGDDTSFRFYIWQLGYAIFPWTGFAPLGLVWWLRRGDSADKGRGDASVFLVMWFVFAFALFSFMGTKFHHYIFPAVPAVAMLIGVVLADVIGDGHAPKIDQLVLRLAGFATGAGLLVFGLSRFLPGSITGVGGPTSLAAANPTMATLLAIVGAGTIGTTLFFSHFAKSKAEAHDSEHDTSSPESDATSHERLLLGAAAAAGAFVLALVGRDLAISAKAQGSDQPGAIRFVHLFTYNYRRPWPDSLDYTAVLTAFTVVAIALSLLFVFAKIRRHAAILFMAFAFVWALWGTDVYMMKLSPHWGQHELMEAYYKDRKGSEEILVAYQMNWKGENFYTGNRVPAFVSSGSPFTKWLREKRDGGAKVMYFVTEHSRTGGLRSEVQAKNYREITDKTINNKFVLVRAEF